MLFRVAVVCASVLGATAAVAQELTPAQARAFIVGKVFAYRCFDGTTGAGRIFGDGSVVGTIRIRGTGPVHFAVLPRGTVQVTHTSMCAHLAGVPIHPCFDVAKINYRSFRGSIAGLSFAYCDFYQRTARYTPRPHAAIPSPRTDVATARRAP
jgi:hypothetical protein